MATQARGKFWIWAVGAFAILFGLMTIKEGGSVLFWSDDARDAAGQFVPFIVWFNFLAGFAYVIAGAGLLFRQRWAAGLSFLILTSTLAAFIAFGIHILGGGEFELRTAIAMCIRSFIWIAIGLVAHKSLWKSVA